MTFQIQTGEPKHPTAVRSRTGASYTNDRRIDHFVAHPIRRWWGLSWKDRWFFGVMTFGATEAVSRNSERANSP